VQQDNTKEKKAKKRMLTFKIFTGSVVIVALFVMSWNIYSASRLPGRDTKYIQPTRSYSSVATSVATRFIGFIVMLYFTYRMWLWDGVPCRNKIKPAATTNRSTVAGSVTQRAGVSTTPKKTVYGHTTVRNSKSSIHHVETSVVRRSSQTTTIPDLVTHIPTSEPIGPSDVELKASSSEQQQQLNNNIHSDIVPSPSRMRTSSTLTTTPVIVNTVSDSSFLSSPSNVVDRRTSYIISNDQSFPISETNQTMNTINKINLKEDDEIRELNNGGGSEQNLSSSMIDPDELSAVGGRSSIASDASEFT